MINLPVGSISRKESDVTSDNPQRLHVRSRCDIGEDIVPSAWRHAVKNNKRSPSSGEFRPARKA